jgi:hypothetical protein
VKNDPKEKTDEKPVYQRKKRTYKDKAKPAEDDEEKVQPKLQKSDSHCKVVDTSAKDATTEDAPKRRPRRQRREKPADAPVDEEIRDKDSAKRPHEKDSSKKPYDKEHSKKPYEKDHSKKPYVKDYEKRPYDKDSA